MTDIDKIFDIYMSKIDDEREKQYREDMEDDRQKLLHCFHQWMRNNSIPKGHGSRVKYRRELYKILGADGELYVDSSEFSSHQETAFNKLNEFIEDCGGEVIETS